MHSERESASISNENALRLLGRKRILFGHQSVGADIVRGIDEIQRGFPEVPFRLIETRDPDVLSAPGFFHCRIGRNTDPESKISDFEFLMEEGFGERLDIAFFKFCYVDIHAKSDIERIFRSYGETMSRLKERYRTVTFVHVTVPVVRRHGFADTLYRRVLGRIDDRREDNAARGRFSEMLAHRFAGSEPIFDLASIESGDASAVPGGSEKKHGFSSPLSPAFTDDGSHLNALGARVAARAMSTLLSGLDGRVAAGT